MHPFQPLRLQNHPHLVAPTPDFRSAMGRAQWRQCHQATRLPLPYLSQKTGLLVLDSIGEGDVYSTRAQQVGEDVHPSRPYTPASNTPVCEQTHLIFVQVP